MSQYMLDVNTKASGGSAPYFMKDQFDGKHMMFWFFFLSHRWGRGGNTKGIWHIFQEYLQTFWLCCRFFHRGWSPSTKQQQHSDGRFWLDFLISVLCPHVPLPIQVHYSFLAHFAFLNLIFFHFLYQYLFMHIQLRSFIFTQIPYYYSHFHDSLKIS